MRTARPGATLVRVEPRRRDPCRGLPPPPHSPLSLRSPPQRRRLETRTRRRPPPSRRSRFPAQTPVVLGGVDWPATTTAEVQAFAYPADGSVLTVGLSQRERVGADGSGGCRSGVRPDGFPVAVRRRDPGDPGDRHGHGRRRGTVCRSRRRRVRRSRLCASSGRTSARRRRASHSRTGARSRCSARTRALAADASSAAQGTIAGLRVVLSAPHGGLAAGSEIVVGLAAATAVAEPVTATPAPPRGIGGAPPPAAQPATPPPPEPEGGGTSVPGGPVRSGPPDVKVRLSTDGYVFPIFGAASFGDSFGGPRPNMPGGWHHGEDIFAPGGRADPRHRGRHAAPDRLHPDRRLPPLAPRRGRERVLLRPSLGVLAARGRGPAREGRRRHRVRRRDGRRRRRRTAPALRDPPRLDARAGLRRRGRPVPVPDRHGGGRRTSRSPRDGSTCPRAPGPGAPTLPPPGAYLLQAEDIASLSGLVPGALERALERKPK